MYFQSQNSTELYTKQFKYIRDNININLDINNLNTSYYNEKFQLHELEFALSKCKGSSPGQDEICYQMIKKLLFDQSWIFTKHL